MSLNLFKSFKGDHSCLSLNHSSVHSDPPFFLFIPELRQLIENNNSCSNFRQIRLKYFPRGSGILKWTKDEVRFFTVLCVEKTVREHCSPNQVRGRALYIGKLNYSLDNDHELRVRYQHDHFITLWLNGTCHGNGTDTCNSLPMLFFTDCFH